MREILFRGKRIDNNEWVYGSFCMDAIEQKKGPCGMDGFIRLFDFDNNKMQMCEVDRDTVGQYTGLTANGKKIFEGDIVRCGTGRICKVVYFTSPSHCGFDLYAVNGFDAPSPIKWRLFADIEVIGNVYDNPELLEVDNGT